ncbi:MAG: DUF447 family protein [Natrialbaceae archaeon]|nr:DUF447 family protein [Natrialbaceae archaeon]
MTDTQVDGRSAFVASRRASRRHGSPPGTWNSGGTGPACWRPGDRRLPGARRGPDRISRTAGPDTFQSTTDPVVFVDAALAIVERDAPIHERSQAWAHVTAESIEVGPNGDWEQWALTPVEATVETRTVPTINRGFGAVIEASVAASRLEIPATDRATSSDGSRTVRAVIERTGGPREREALEHIVSAHRLDAGAERIA